MKKIITLLTLICVSHLINAQSITSFSSTSLIQCNGGNTSCLVQTDDSVNTTLTYILELDNGTGYNMYWGFPQTSNNNLSIPTLFAGAYRIIIQNNLGAYLDTFDYFLTQPSAINVVAQNSLPVSCLNGSDGEYSLSVIGGTPPFSFFWTNGTTISAVTTSSLTSSISNLSAGSYTCDITDANNCFLNGISFTITQPSTSVSLSSSSTSNVCNGDNSGTATVVASGGTSGYTYSWDNGQITPTATNLLASVYNCIVTDMNGCSVSSNVTVSQPSILSATISANNSVSCNGGNNGSASVNVTGGVFPYSYLWTGLQSPTNQTLSTATGLYAGTYDVYTSDANGCSSFNSPVTTVITQPFAELSLSNISSTQVTCNGGGDGTTTVLITGGTFPYTYLWSNGQTSLTATSLIAGTYDCDITDANGCTLNSGAILVNQPIAPISVSSFSTLVSCNSGSDGTAQMIVSGGTPPYSYSWSNGLTTQSINNLTANNYSCSITDVNGCLYPANPVLVTVSQPSQPFSSSVIFSDVSCFGGTDGSASVNLTGGTPPYSYSWSNGSTVSSISNVSSGSYICNIIDANGCEHTGTTAITIPISQPQLPISYTTDTTSVSCNGGNNGTATIIPTGGTSPYTYLWSNGLSSPTITSLIIGYYTCIITDNNGCTENNITNPIQVTEPSTLLSINTTVVDVSCFSGTNGMATAIANGGISPYAYSWSNGFLTTSITGLNATTYQVSVTDDNNCVETEDVTVSQPNQIQILFNNIDVSCNNGSDGSATALITGGTPPYSFLWSDGQTTQTASSLSEGSYTVTVIDSFNCAPVNATILISDPQIISVLPTLSDVSCTGGYDGSINLSITGGYSPYTFLWSNTQTSQNSSGLTAGFYNVVITDDSNCSVTSMFNIFEPSDSLVAMLNIVDVSCFGGNDGTANTLVTGGTLPYDYVWTFNGQNSQSVTSLYSNSYTCTVIDDNDCIAYATGTVGEPSQISLTNSITSPSCNGYQDGSATIIPQGGTSPYSYYWSNSQTTPTSINLTSGQYSVLVQDSLNCPVSYTILVTEPNPISINIVTTDVSCNGNASGVANATSFGTFPPFTYIYSDGTNQQINMGMLAASYSLEVFDLTGCSNTEYFTINEPSQITASLTPVNVSVSGGSDGSISSIVSGGEPSYVYSWTGPNGFTSSLSSINNLESGSYSLTVTDDNNCQQQFYQVVSQPNCNILIDSNYSAPQCYSDVFGLLSWDITNGVAPYSNMLLDSDSNVVISGMFSSPNQSLQLSAGVYDLVIEDATGCQSILNLQVILPDSISIFLNLTDANCYGSADGIASATIIGGVSPYLINWGPGNTNPNTLIAGGYNIMVTDDNQCVSIVNYTINEPTQIVIDSINTNVVSCVPGNDGSATIYSSGGTLPHSYQWISGQTTQTSVNLTTGIYNVTVFDAHGCSVTSNPNSIQIMSAPILNTTLITTNINCTGGSDGSISSVVNGGTAPYTYVWSNSYNSNVVISNNSSISNLSNGAYSLLTTDVNGCIDQDNISLTNPATITFNLQPTNISSNGANNGVIYVTNLSGGQPPYSYIWTGPTGNLSFPVMNPIPPLTNLSSGQYTLSITDANNCSSNMSTSINEPACNLLINETVVQPICFGLPASLNWTISGGVSPYDNTLTNLSTNQILMNSNVISTLSLVEGFYSLKVEDLYGCSEIINIAIDAPEPLTANISITDVSCFGYSDGTVSVIPSGGTTPYSYSYNGVNPSALYAGIFTLSVSDANGCNTLPSPITYQVLEPDDINVSYSTTSVSCTNGGDGTASVSVSGGSFPYTYLWSPAGDNTPSISNLSYGFQYISVTDANQCVPSTGPTPVYISQPTNSIICNINPTAVSCNGYSDGEATAYGYGGTPPYSFLWSNGITSQTAYSLYAGTYNCAVTDANGCTSVSSTTITEPSEILVNISITNVSCNGLSDGSAIVNPSGGSGYFNVMWPNGTVNYGINNLAAGFHFVTLTDNTGCTPINNPTIFEITQPDELNSQTSIVSEPSCHLSSNGEVTVLVTGGTQIYSYEWKDNNGTLISQSTSGNNISQGTYIVDVTDANNCTLSDTIILTAPDSISPNLTIDSSSCFGVSDGSAQVNPTGGTSPYTYSWTGPGSNTNSITGLTANSPYYVQIVDNNGCSGLSTLVTISEPSNLDLTVDIFDADCNGGSEGSLYITSTSGGTSPYTYLWYNGNTGMSDTNLSAGSYIITTIDNNGCIYDNSFIVGQPSTLTVESFENIIIDCNGASNGSVYANASGGTFPYSYSWNSPNIINNTTNPTLFNLNSGTYYVIVTDENGCTSNDNITLENPLEVSIDFDTSDFNGYNISCYGGNNGSVWLTASGGRGSQYTYSWNFGSVNDTITNLSPGTYSVTVTDSVGCSITESITLSEPLPLNLTTNFTPTSCFDSINGTATVSTLGGAMPYTYLWSDGQTTIVASNLESASYNVVVTDINGCPDSTTVLVTQPSIVNPEITINNLFNGFAVQCADSANASVTITTTGGNGSQYIYSTDIGFNNPTPLSVFNNLGIGTFYIFSQDNNGCIGSDSVYINGPNQISSNVTPINVTCSGGNNGSLFSNPLGGISPYNYEWSNGLIGNSLNQGLHEGVYVLTITDDNLCVSIDTFNLTANYLIQANISTVLVNCSGTATGSATIDSVYGGTFPYTYLWSNTSTTPNIGGLIADTITVTITDSNGCNITEEVIVEEAQNILTFDSVLVNDLACHNDSSGVISVFAIGGVSPYSYTLTDTLFNIISNNNVSYMLDAKTYIATVTDSASCMYSINVVVNEPLLISTNLTVNNISCFGYSDGYMVTNTTGGTLPYTHTWIGPNNYSSTFDSINNLSQGTYMLSISDLNECMYSDTFIIVEPLQLSFGVLTSDPSCYNYTNGAISIGVIGGVYPYNASFGSVLPTSFVGDSIFFDNLTASTNMLMVTDLNNCVSQYSIVLTNPLLLEVKSNTETNPTCFDYSDATASIDAKGGTLPYNYYVYDANNNEVGNSSTTTNLSDGDYSYKIVDENGCEIDLSFNINEPSEIEITENTITHIDCFNDQTGSLLVDIQNTFGNYQIFWTNVSEDSVFIYNLGSGIYKAIVIDENNCIKTDSFEIIQQTEIIADISSVNSSCYKIADGIIYVDNISGGVPPYKVFNNSEMIVENEMLSAIIPNLLSTTDGIAYNISIRDDYNCVVQEQLMVDFDGGYTCIEEPIIISPNADGINDNWKPILDVNTDMEVSILNRWGNLEYYYSGNSISFSWDGTATNGNKLPSTDYYFIIKFNNSSYPDRTGAITLIR